MVFSPQGVEGLIVVQLEAVLGQGHCGNGQDTERAGVEGL